MSLEPLPVIESGPEAVFQISEVTHGGGTVTASMPSGDWLRRPDGAVPAGVLGVLVDDVLGYALFSGRPADHWSVSAEITLDVVGPLPADGWLRAEGSLVQADALGGFATGRVTTEDGRLVALAGQRGRFVAALGVGAEATAYSPIAGSEDVVPWLGRRYVGTEPFVVPDLLANPMGNVHGGISLCLSDLVARDALGGDLVTASVHTTYTRGIPTGSTLRYDAQVLHGGRSLAVVDVTGSVDGKRATVSRVVLQPRTG